LHIFIPLGVFYGVILPTVDALGFLFSLALLHIIY
jgi:hypothetical protein